jgi:MFS family permease
MKAAFRSRLRPDRSPEVNAAPSAPEDAAPYFRWNFAWLQVDVSTFVLGLAFLDATTVLPLLLDRLGATSWMIGAAQACQTLGMTLPPLFAAHWIHGRRRHLGFLVTVTGLGRAALLTLLPVLLLWGTTHPGWVLAWFFVVYSFFWVMDGACHVSWLDIIAKTIPAQFRGRLFGTMQVISGLLGIGASLIVQQVLRPGSLTFPGNFALLLTLWCAGAAISQFALFLLRESDGEVPSEQKPPLAVYLARTPSFLRVHRRVAQIIAIRILLGAAAIATPFYALFAIKHLGVPASAAGVYLMAARIGEISTGALWAYLSDRFSPALALRVAAAGVLLTPLAALLAAGGHPWLFPVAFFALGGTGPGVWLLASNALLEAVPDRDRPLAVGITSLCQAPTALYPVLGGILLKVGLPYAGLFALTLALTAVGFLATLRLPVTPPRRD